jgi:preprotein translocase subunit SecG
MNLLAALSWSHYFFIFSLSLLSIFMVLVILVQRGRGGGLTGALGGMGGQSAFGTKAGDLFTRITIVVAALWVLLAMAALKILNPYDVSGFNRSLRGQATPPTKTGEGGLLFGGNNATSPAGEQSADGKAPGGKAADGEKSAPAAEAPSPSPPASAAPATTEAAPASPPGEAKSSESAKP